MLKNYTSLQQTGTNKNHPETYESFQEVPLAYLTSFSAGDKD
jgi:hypothetical protein